MAEPNTSTAPDKTTAKTTTRYIFEKVDQKTSQNTLKQTLYSSVVIAPICYNSKMRNTWKGFLLSMVFPQWLLLLINYFIQVTSLYFVIIHVEEKVNTEAHQLNDLVCFCCFFLFNAILLQELFDTSHLFDYIYHHPTGNFELIQEHKTIKDGPDGSEEEFLTYTGGIPRWYQWFCICFVVIPKLFIGIALMYYGRSFLLTSENDIDLVLNSLALTFIIEVDETLHERLSTLTFKEEIERMPPLPFHKINLTFDRLNPWTMIILLMFFHRPSIFTFFVFFGCWVGFVIVLKVVSEPKKQQ